MLNQGQYNGQLKMVQFILARIITLRCRILDGYLLWRFGKLEIPLNGWNDFFVNGNSDNRNIGFNYFMKIFMDILFRISYYTLILLIY